MLRTYSLFYYGITVDDSNQFIDFSDASGSWVATLSYGSYTLTQLAKEVRKSMNSSGTSKRYLVTVDRVTRKLTIKTQDLSVFSLNFATGPNTNRSACGVMGFSNTDKTSQNEYQSEFSVGKEFKPQFFLQNYLPLELNRTPIRSSVNVSASGNYVEVVGYNQSRIVRFDLRFVTNNFQLPGSLIRNNPNGVSDCIDFLNYVTSGSPVEFMPDEDKKDQYYQLIIVSTETSADGVGFELEEELPGEFDGYYSVKKLTFREIL